MITELIKVKIKLNSYEKNLLGELMDRRGFSQDDVFRIALRVLHKKEFPTYLKISKKDMTPEQRCMAEGGQVVEREGVKKCAVKRGELEYE